MHFASPPLTKKIVRHRATNIGAEDTTHCALCSDDFLQQGKRATHILDPVFAQPGVSPAPCAGVRIVSR